MSCAAESPQSLLDWSGAPFIDSNSYHMWFGARWLNPVSPSGESLTYAPESTIYADKMMNH